MLLSCTTGPEKKSIVIAIVAGLVFVGGCGGGGDFEVSIAGTVGTVTMTVGPYSDNYSAMSQDKERMEKMAKMAYRVAVENPELTEIRIAKVLDSTGVKDIYGKQAIPIKKTFQIQVLRDISYIRKFSDDKAYSDWVIYWRGDYPAWRDGE